MIEFEKIASEGDFNTLAIDVFHYQYDNNHVYREYCDLLNVRPYNVSHYSEIPFLPIEFFKTHKVVTCKGDGGKVFQSSGTTGKNTSKHYVCNPAVYEKSFMKAFRIFYGDIKEYCILALLPSYIEQGNSSLVYMVTKLIEESGNNSSGFYLNNYEELSQKLRQLSENNQKVILIGVTYALLDLAEQYPQQLRNTIIMETGGMKGRRREIVREELHGVLRTAFDVDSIHSEYGMTELFSQAYSKGDSIFKTPPWMRIMIRDTYDPFSYLQSGQSGGVNVIDLANIYSCSFIETKDIGKVLGDRRFTILGRFDNSDVRGCNLMVD